MHKNKATPEGVQVNLIEFDVDDDERKSMHIGPGGTWSAGGVRLTLSAAGDLDVDVSAIQAEAEAAQENEARIDKARERAQANVDKANAQLGEIRSHAAAALLGRGRTVRPDHDEAQLVEQLAGLVAEDAETFARQLGTIAHLEADVARERAGRIEAAKRAERDGKRLDRIVDALAVEAGRGILRPLMRRLGRVIGGARG